MRHQGAGQFLGRVLEAEAVEALALSGGLLGLLAVIEVVMAACVLGTGAGGWLHVGLLVGWLGVAGGLGWHCLRQRRDWTAARLTMTHALVERLVGHRTRLAQESPERWHIGEDQELAAYLAASHRLDLTQRGSRRSSPWLAPRRATRSGAGAGGGPRHSRLGGHRRGGDVAGL